jgi:hypothetical protein
VNKYFILVKLLIISILSLFFLSSVYAYDLDFLSKQDKKTFAKYFRDDFLIQNSKNQMSVVAKNKLEKILKARVQESKKMEQMRLNLISWPSEDRLIYRYSEKILKGDKK